jgi:hypothetical protein
MPDLTYMNNVPDPLLAGKELPHFTFALEKSTGKVIGGGLRACSSRCSSAQQRGDCSWFGLTFMLPSYRLQLPSERSQLRGSFYASRESLIDWNIGLR